MGFLNHITVHIVLFTLVTVARAWWESGHFIVAQIAKAELLEKNPAVFKLAEELVLYMPWDHPISPTSFLDAAVWLDDLKKVKWSYWSSWHFITLPYNPDGIELDLPDRSNILTAFELSMQHLSDPKWHGYKTIPKSMFLRMLIHIVADMHLTVHTASMFSKELPPPHGDRGANKINVKFNNKKIKLHFLWDSIFFDVDNSHRKPLSQAGIDYFENYSMEIMKEHPRESLDKELEVKNVTEWVWNTHQDAVEYVYKPLPKDRIITEEYRANGVKVCRRSLALAGYRLADLILDLLKTKEN